MLQTPATEPRAVGGGAARLPQLELQPAQLAVARKENAALRRRVVELERSAGLDSSNSGKRSGGKPGQKGRNRRRTATPEQVVDHWPGQCRDCGV